MVMREFGNRDGSYKAEFTVKPQLVAMSCVGPVGMRVSGGRMRAAANGLNLDTSMCRFSKADTVEWRETEQ